MEAVRHYNVTIIFHELYVVSRCIFFILYYRHDSERGFVFKKCDQKMYGQSLVSVQNTPLCCKE